MDQQRRLLLERRSILLQLLAARQSNNRSCSVRTIFKERQTLGAYHSLIPRMRAHDISSYVNFLRVTPTQLDFIVDRVGASLTKPDTNFRKAVSPGEKVCLTLRYLASGDSMRSLSYMFRLGYSTVSGIIADTSAALWDNLADYLKPPENEAEWESIAAEFEKKWQFPHCVGAIDGKHVNIQAPPNSGTLFYNYKNFYSMVIMAVVDANYSFTIVNIGDYGHNSDSGIFSNTDFGKALAAGSVPLPKESVLPQTSCTLPYVFVADEAFPLKPYMMRPYSSKDLDTKKRIFNYRLSRARRIVENAFGILSARFRILRQPIVAKVETIESIIKACVVLHNFILKGSDSTQIVGNVEIGDFDSNDRGLLSPGPQVSQRTCVKRTHV